LIETPISKEEPKTPTKLVRSKSTPKEKTSKASKKKEEKEEEKKEPKKRRGRPKKSIATSSLSELGKFII